MFIHKENTVWCVYIIYWATGGTHYQNAWHSRDHYHHLSVKENKHRNMCLIARRLCHFYTHHAPK